MENKLCRFPVGNFRAQFALFSSYHNYGFRRMYQSTIHVVSGGLNTLKKCVVLKIPKRWCTLLRAWCIKNECFQRAIDWIVLSIVHILNYFERKTREHYLSVVNCFCLKLKNSLIYFHFPVQPSFLDAPALQTLKYVLIITRSPCSTHTRCNVYLQSIRAWL